MRQTRNATPIAAAPKTVAHTVKPATARGELCSVRARPAVREAATAIAGPTRCRAARAAGPWRFGVATRLPQVASHPQIPAESGGERQEDSEPRCPQTSTHGGMIDRDRLLLDWGSPKSALECSIIYLMYSDQKQRGPRTAGLRSQTGRTTRASWIASNAGLPGAAHLAANAGDLTRRTLGCQRPGARLAVASRECCALEHSGRVDSEPRTRAPASPHALQTGAGARRYAGSVRRCPTASSGSALVSASYVNWRTIRRSVHFATRRLSERRFFVGVAGAGAPSAGSGSRLRRVPAAP